MIRVGRPTEEDLILASLARGERIENYEAVGLARAGRTITVSVTVSHVRNANGPSHWRVQIVGEITEVSERGRGCLSARLSLFVEHTPGGIAMFDSEVRDLAASRRFLSDFQRATAPVSSAQYEIFPDLPQRWRDSPLIPMRRPGFEALLLALFSTRKHADNVEIGQVARVIDPPLRSSLLSVGAIDCGTQNNNARARRM